MKLATDHMSADSVLDEACDCHVHIVAPAEAWPMVPDRHYTPPPASVAALQAHMRRVGVGRAVVVQPSIYGTDNRLLLQALQEMGNAARGVAVLAPGIEDAELQALDQRGVRGIRLNLESAAGRDVGALDTQLEEWARRIAPYGWHLQVYAAFDVHQAMLDRYDSLPVPVVLDHYAMAQPQLNADDPGMQRLQRSLQRGNVYVKLSASYRIGPRGRHDAAGVTRLARTLIAANPERLLWASDWPHTNREPGKAPTEVSAYRDVPAQRLVEERETMFTDSAERQRVLVDNPQRLYRHDAGLRRPDGP